MQLTDITIIPSTLYLTYNVFNKALTGDFKFTGLVKNIFDEPASDFSLAYSVDQADFFYFIPNSVSDASSTTLIELRINDLLFNLSSGDYSFNVIFSSVFAEDLTVLLNLKVIDQNPDEGGGGDDPKEYYLKYLLENSDVEGNETILEIHEVDYDGVVIPIYGKVKLNYQSKTDLFEPIIASNIKLELQSSLALTLNDLYSEEERFHKVFLKRNGSVIFIGFIKPDGIYEDYVSDIWILSISAYDGLSTLKDLTFSNVNGVSYLGKFTGLDIIQNALLKTGLDLPLNINCNVFYDTFSGDNIFKETIFNTQRFFQSQAEAMDCESVVKSLLQIFNATIVQMDGEWYIYRSIDISGSLYFQKFINGVFIETFEVNPIIQIGSQIDGFELFHTNKNQKKSIASSVQAYRITYQYGGASNIFKNGELKLTGSGLDIDGWNVFINPTHVERLPSGYGLSSAVTNIIDEKLISLNQSIDINNGMVFKVIFSFANERQNTRGLRFSVGIGGNNWFNIETESWQSTEHINYIANSNGQYTPPNSIYVGKGNASYEVTLRSPAEGNLNLTVYKDYDTLGGGEFKIYSINVAPGDIGNINGMNYTAKRTKRISTVKKENVTVYNGDSVSDLYVGTIYKSDADTPTRNWHRGGLSESKQLLSINAEDNLRISPRPMTIFEGDVYGYIPYFSLININNFGTKKFMPINYSFDFNKNILKLTTKEFSSKLLFENEFNVEIAENNGAETKVTIR